MQPHRLSLCPGCTTSSFSPQGLCTDIQVPAHLHMRRPCVCITHMYAGTVIYPKGPQRPSPALLSKPYSQVGLQAGPAIPQKVWPLDWWDSLGSCGQCPCPHLGAGTAHVCAKWSLDSLSQHLHKGVLVLAPPHNLPVSCSCHRLPGSPNSFRG